MFDFRYHVASLAAVFLALGIGIVVGVGISGRGLLDEAERTRLNNMINQLRSERDAANLRKKEDEADVALARSGYRALVANRLDGKRIAIVFVGKVDDGVRTTVEDTVAEAGGTVTRVRGLEVPIATDDIESAIETRRALRGYLGQDKLDDLGRDLAGELVDGGETPLWVALSDTLVEEQTGGMEDAVDGVVLSRTALPQPGETGRFLRGFYSGLKGSTPAAVGVESSTAEISAVRAYRRAGLSSVDDVDLPNGRVSLVVLLAGGPPGHYGIKEGSTGPVPPIEPLPPTG